MQEKHNLQVKHNVVAGLLRCDGRVLLMHRGPHRDWYPGVWDLPGGHVEPGEAPSSALVRELDEELGIAIAPPVAEPSFVLDDAEFQLAAWWVDTWTGEIAMCGDEHDDMGWFDAEAVAGLKLADSRYLAWFGGRVNALP